MPSKASDYRVEAAAALSKRPAGGTSSLPRVLLLAGLVLAALALIWSSRRVASFRVSPYPVAKTIRFRPEIATLPVMSAGIQIPTEIPVEFEFRRGETLSDVLDVLGFEPLEAHVVATEVAKYADLRKLRPRDRYAALIDGDSNFKGFQITLVGQGKVAVRRGSDGEWAGSWEPFVRTVEIRSIEGQLSSGILEDSLKDAGGEAQLAYLMSDVFQWDLDFNRDLRLGDRFEVLYEGVLLDAEYTGPGEILAVTYDNLGKQLEAYRFGEEPSYYDADGRPLRKMFLRSPLRYSRVTSSFSNRRFHPVLKRYQPHHGVDYGAPTGTPVQATANGVVTSAGWNGGGGKTVKVRHPNGYLTAYLHLSRFAKGVTSGRRVTQGQVIGYVGSTGLATASHLDYRIQHDGKWINPQSLKSAPAEPIPEAQLPEFVAERDRFRVLMGVEIEPQPPTDEEAQRLADAESHEQQPVPVSGQ
ncbi:MAG: M23 family metallopeptidase [Thermoanaerobaculia bacterium]